MSADHDNAAAPPDLAAVVLTVIRGADLRTTAADIGLHLAELDEAVQAYQAAGRAALERRAEGEWYGVRISFLDATFSQKIVVRWVAPALDRLQADGAIRGWWFSSDRLAWTLWLHRADITVVDGVLDDLADDLRIVDWVPTVYEPELAAFGGFTGLNVVHDLYCADSRGVLDHARRKDVSVDRRQLSIMLLDGLFSAARLDEFERADVFERVRRLIPDATTFRKEQPESLRDLMFFPGARAAEMFAPDGSLAYAAPWLAAFQAAGSRLADDEEQGWMNRGRRAILARIVLSHWNRLAFSASGQRALADAAALSRPSRR
ncbi:thiopeptide-type bacteriocin biosynthesis protein [Actinoalloteichus hymeniacidonis]|uniref:Thiopeptide-type bacteriocin biosynthesis domain n=1 Tax=Actinoalloteichus hymeniacidonis TaxID=340345 RepID=A0AAC9HSW4_9PSEU|nr:thiopeptide-type bacteriocin biosynthesis protein [Actinoalloteichus hymeniacidonis]AOS64734.1 thiopeptide-type bacteriocin biosynthesis domain [Actinoalloteichus hymeniacidonis]MBB5907190.1 thiopeptide-type bacteriocin biosynthesis protein [Actinoalloteichus hymeniacidonis]